MNSRLNRNLFLLAAGAGLSLAAAVLARNRRAYSLEGKSVLITGGSRGLGLLLAREFGLSGARPAICARNERELALARTKLEQAGIKALTVQCDISRKDDVDRMLEEVRSSLGSIDILVNNAGIIHVGPADLMEVEDYEEAMGVYFWGPLFSILGVLPDMIKRREGRIVNISSIGGKISVPHLLPYCAGKFALTGLSEGLRPELARHNIHVTTVCPGLMRTGSPKHGLFKGQHTKEYAWFSILASMPGLSMNALKAARQIVRACAAGEREIVLTSPAKIAVRFNGLFPELTQHLMEYVSLMLPESECLEVRAARNTHLPGLQLSGRGLPGKRIRYNKTQVDRPSAFRDHGARSIISARSAFDPVDDRRPILRLSAGAHLPGSVSSFHLFDRRTQRFSVLERQSDRFADILDHALIRSHIVSADRFVSHIRILPPGIDVIGGKLRRPRMVFSQSLLEQRRSGTSHLFGFFKFIRNFRICGIGGALYKPWIDNFIVFLSNKHFFANHVLSPHSH